MIKQRFFAPPGYKPLVYGYGRGSFSGWRKRVARYAKLKYLGPVEFLEEPVSKKALEGPFRMRPLGACERLKPTDHLIVDCLDALTTRPKEIPEIDFWMSERGIHWHVVDLWGCSLDSDSPMGRMMIHNLGMAYELNCMELAGRWENARRRARAAKRHAGACAPFFCKFIECEGGKRLEFHDWALSLMELAACGHDVSRELRIIWGFENLPHRQAHIYSRRLATFYMAWSWFKKPDINSVVISDMVEAYKERTNGT